MPLDATGRTQFSKGRTEAEALGRILDDVEEIWTGCWITHEAEMKGLHVG